jgi:hypothetical protein
MIPAGPGTGALILMAGAFCERSSPAGHLAGALGG